MFAKKYCQKTKIVSCKYVIFNVFVKSTILIYLAVGITLVIT